MTHHYRRGLALAAAACVAATVNSATAGAVVDEVSGSAEAFAVGLAETGGPLPSTAPGLRVDLPPDGEPTALETTGAAIDGHLGEPGVAVPVGTIGRVDLRTEASGVGENGATVTSDVQLSGVELLTDWSGGIQIDEVTAKCTVPATGPVVQTSVSGLVVFGQPVEPGGPTSLTVAEGDHEMAIAISPGPAASSTGPHGGGADTLALRLTVVPEPALERPTVVLELGTVECAYRLTDPVPDDPTSERSDAPNDAAVMGVQQTSGPARPVDTAARFTG
jgi:hypothetical protein